MSKRTEESTLNASGLNNLAKNCAMTTNFFCYRDENISKSSSMWVAYSSAPQHMTRKKEYFADFVKFAQPMNVKVRNGHFCLRPGHCKLKSVH
ncbi:hypothetical protein T07_2010 [Trichinella nelsoni]|uniref:Uncharacterized protein n=1 Tax=Trichinella nelsoni TaxID=6336 RepID=A0A0V0SI41_9BILA|nr:hypothetical protein T07_2010 [Trichinella nelsoni]